MQLAPGFEAFAASYGAGKPALVWTSLVSDLETPVSAMLKLADGRPMSFLFESVEGGAARGRYSFIGLKPDLIWRCRNGRAEINRKARFDADAFEPAEGRALAEPRAHSSPNAASRRRRPSRRWRPASSAISATTWSRRWSASPTPSRTASGYPTDCCVRPTVVCIFDTIEDRVTAVTPVWPEPGSAPAPPMTGRASGCSMC